MSSSSTSTALNLHHHDKLNQPKRHQQHQQHQQQQQQHYYYYALGRSDGEGLWERTLYHVNSGGGESSDDDDDDMEPPSPTPLPPPEGLQVEPISIPTPPSMLSSSLSPPPSPLLPHTHPQEEAVTPHHQSNRFPSTTTATCNTFYNNHLLTNDHHPHQQEQQQEPTTTTTTIEGYVDGDDKKNDIRRRGIMQHVLQPQIYIDQSHTTTTDQVYILQQQQYNEANDLKTLFKQKASLKFNSISECWTNLEDYPIINNQQCRPTTIQTLNNASPLQFTQYYAIKCLDLKYKYERCWNRLYLILCILDSLQQQRSNYISEVLVLIEFLKFDQDEHSPNYVVNERIEPILETGRAVITLLNQEFNNANNMTDCLSEIINKLNNNINELMNVGNDFKLNYQPHVNLVINEQLQ